MCVTHHEETVWWEERNFTLHSPIILQQQQSLVQNYETSYDKSAIIWTRSNGHVVITSIHRNHIDEKFECYQVFLFNNIHTSVNANWQILSNNNNLSNFQQKVIHKRFLYEINRLIRIRSPRANVHLGKPTCFAHF